jgi:hypothetical protein
MKTYRRLLRLLLIPVLFLAFSSQMPARADIAPMGAAGYGGPQPFQDQATEVQMVYERVEMELEAEPPPTENYYAPINTINVIAWFVMRNQGVQDEAMQVIFPLWDMNFCLDWEDISASPSNTHYIILGDTFKVSVDGVDIPVTEVSTEHPYKDRSYFCANIGMNWAAFDVTFAVGKDVLIRIEYSMQASGGDVIPGFYVLESVKEEHLYKNPTFDVTMGHLS